MWLSGVSIVCFAASYAVALVLELTRLWFRSAVRGALMVGFAGAGLLAHTVYLFYQAVHASGSPLSSKQDWYLLAAWMLTALYLLLTAHHPKTPYGLFVLPLVLALIAVGRYFADPNPFPREPASQVWGAIHGSTILLATVSVLAAFVAGLMYLGQARRLKRKLPAPLGLRLPSLEWLQRVNSRALTFSLLMVGVSIASGVVLNLINYDRDLGRIPWSDPIILATTGMFAWLALSTLAGWFYRPAREGNKVVYLTLVSFVFLLIALASSLFFNSRHSGAKPSDRRAAAGARKAASPSASRFQARPTVAALYGSIPRFAVAPQSRDRWSRWIALEPQGHCGRNLTSGGRADGPAVLAVRRVAWG